MFYFSKTNIRDLAIFGGKATFENALHVGRPNIGNQLVFEERVKDIIERRWFSNGGRYVFEFEKAITDHIGVKNCIVVTNATVALEIAIRALELEGEVIVPSYTFIATVHALQWLGITPVFCDIDPHSYNIDPQKIEALITPRTRGIIGVHVYGRPCNTDALEAIANKHNLLLLYDAAHAFGCSYKGQMLGNFGKLEVFSFHATKFLNSLEGGAIVTNDDDLAIKIRRMTNFGFSNYDQVEYVGINGKMNEISAAMGLTNIEAIEDLVEVNRLNYFLYKKNLVGLNGIKIIEYDQSEKNNFQYLVIDVDSSITGIDRDQIVKILHAENVLARRYFYPGCHRLNPYRTMFPNAKVNLGETERVTNRVICLPTGTGVRFDQIEQICQLIRFIVEHGAEVLSYSNIP